MPKLKVLTVVGTRPEIIRLSETIKYLDVTVDHVLVHTGQNYDYELNQVFFENLGIRKPDHFLEINTDSLGKVLGGIIIETEKIINLENPDAMVILGDTNSSIAAIVAKRLRVPVYHMEAGNRCFDDNVPEETNRKLVDHVSDYNLVYTEHARRNLLSEGLHPSRILLTGSPMREVLIANNELFKSSEILSTLSLSKNEYFLVSLHREENVDNPQRLQQVVGALKDLHAEYGLPVLVSTHPRTRNRLSQSGLGEIEGLIFHKPFGFHDYVFLQMNAKLVLSDSGTISEEASLLGFKAITLRDSIERPEALDAGAIITSGLSPDSVLDSVRIVLQEDNSRQTIPSGYEILDTSRRVVNFIRSTAVTHHARNGIRFQKPVK